MLNEVKYSRRFPRTAAITLGTVMFAMMGLSQAKAQSAGQSQPEITAKNMVSKNL